MEKTEFPFLVFPYLRVMPSCPSTASVGFFISRQKRRPPPWGPRLALLRTSEPSTGHRCVQRSTSARKYSSEWGTWAESARDGSLSAISGDDPETGREFKQSQHLPLLRPCQTTGMFDVSFSRRKTIVPFRFRSGIPTLLFVAHAFPLEVRHSQQKHSKRKRWMKYLTDSMVSTSWSTSSMMTSSTPLFTRMFCPTE